MHVTSKIYSRLSLEKMFSLDFTINLESPIKISNVTSLLCVCVRADEPAGELV